MSLKRTTRGREGRGEPANEAMAAAGEEIATAVLVIHAHMVQHHTNTIPMEQ